MKRPIHGRSGPPLPASSPALATDGADGRSDPSEPGDPAPRPLRRGIGVLDSSIFRERLVYRLVAVLGVLPIVVEVVRSGLSGWIPVQDAAPTVLRAKFAIGFSPTLVGMFTDSSRYAGATTYFPGPWQLYWLWAPVRLLGTTWGPLVGMGLLNVVWLLLAGWFVKRRLGYRAGAAALVFASVLNWVLSPALLVSPVPMVMVLPAFTAFCFGVWALASGDEGVLPLLSVVANFLLLDHLVLSALVPVIGIVGLGCWIVGVVLDRRADPAVWPGRRRRMLRSIAGAWGVALVMWLPALVQQFTHHPGNLVNLWRAGRSQPDAVLSLGDAAVKFLSLFTAPNFWLRPSRTTSYLLSSAPQPSAAALSVVCLLGAALWLFGVRRAWRRRDRPALAGLVLAVAAFGAACITITRAVGPVLNPARGYVQSCWVVAMFITFALGYALSRSIPSPVREFRFPVLVGVAVLVAALNLPHAAVTFGVTSASDPTIRRSRLLAAAVLDAVDGDGVVAVRAGGPGSYPYTAATIVALNDAGIPMCADRIPQFEPSPMPTCRGFHTDNEVRFVRGELPQSNNDGWRVLATESPLTDAEKSELAAAAERIEAAVDHVAATGRKIAFAPELVAYVNRTKSLAFLRSTVNDEAKLNPPGGLMSSAAGRKMLARSVDVGELVVGYSRQHSQALEVDPFHVPGITNAELTRWAHLQTRTSSDTFSVLIRRPR